WIYKEGMIYSDTDDSGKTIASCDDDEVGERIVKCCNSHNGLVKIVELASVLLPENLDNLDAADFKDRAFYITQLVREARQLVREARQALEAAK
ncbi:hypothetical protein LCGC14_2134720, partial [marine sediment metagenome]